MAFPLTVNALGNLVQQISNDGNIVRRQIPTYINIRLEQSQIKANAADVKGNTYPSGVNDFLYFAHGRCVFERVSDHEDPIHILGNFNERQARLKRMGDGLLHKYMFAVKKRCSGQFIVSEYRCGNADSVQTRILKKRCGLRGRFDVRIESFNTFEPIDIFITTYQHVGISQPVEIPNQIRSPVSASNNTKINHSCPPFFSFLIPSFA